MGRSRFFREETRTEKNSLRQRNPHREKYFWAGKFTRKGEFFERRTCARILGGEQKISDEKQVATLIHLESIISDTTRVSFRFR